MKQICYDNDPNIADKNLQNYNSDDNWNAIISKFIIPPFIPKVKSNLDTSNFEKVNNY